MYRDYITVRPELIDEEGSPTGQPSPLPGVAATYGGSFSTADGIPLCQLCEEAFQEEPRATKLFLCRVRTDGELPLIHSFSTVEEFKASHPEVWTAAGMEPRSYLDEETGEEVTIEPQIPVFL